MHYDLAILGAGAAGMIAAVAAGEIAAAANKPLRILLLEKNTRPGIKVLVCGGGRCNFTNAGSIQFLIEQFGRNGRFLTPALRHLDNDALVQFFADRNVPSHVEPGGKIYPNSNQAKSVVDALVNNINRLGVDIRTGPEGTVTTVTRDDLFHITTQNNTTYTASTLLLTAGGMSYQKMGTTGDGYAIATSLGHSLVTPRPAIVGLLTAEEWPTTLKGLAVRDVEVKIAVSGPLPTLATGKPTPSIHDILFTHFGLSGPAILNPSEIVAELLEKFPQGVPLKIGFARHHTHEQLHALFRSWQQSHGKKQLKKLLTKPTPDILISTTSPDQTDAADDSIPTTKDFSIPHRLADKFLELEQIPPDQPCSILSSAQIHRLVERIKSTCLTITSTRGFKEAMVTAGGIKLAEVDPHTLESKITKNLFLAGEVLDLTGPSGGYNLQLAFSTGHLAGTTIAQRLTAP